MPELCAEVHPSGERCTLPKNHEGNHRLDFSVHRCHARECMTRVKPEMLMCKRHWFMVPPDIRNVGQCDDKEPSGAWHIAASAAIGVVAVKENEPIRVAEVEALKHLGYETKEHQGRLVVRKRGS